MRHGRGDEDKFKALLDPAENYEAVMQAYKDLNAEDQQASAAAQVIAQPQTIILIEDRCFDQLTIKYAVQE